MKFRSYVHVHVAMEDGMVVTRLNLHCITLIQTSLCESNTEKN
jgi:hypothetical protein